jgi:phosphate starvation-inducible protein PhoH
MFVDMVRDVEGVGEFVFTDDDIVRSKILKEIVKRYEEWKYRGTGGTGSNKGKF